MFCVFVWVFRLMCLCVVYVDDRLMLYGLLLCASLCVAFLFNECVLFVNVPNGVVWFAYVY